MEAAGEGGLSEWGLQEAPGWASAHLNRVPGAQLDGAGLAASPVDSLMLRKRLRVPEILLEVQKKRRALR